MGDIMRRRTELWVSCCPTGITHGRSWQFSTSQVPTQLRLCKNKVEQRSIKAYKLMHYMNVWITKLVYENICI